MVRRKTSCSRFATLCASTALGAVAARAFYEAGFGSVATVAGASASDMLTRVNAINEKEGYYKAKLGEKDMQFCIDYAKLLELYN